MTIHQLFLLVKLGKNICYAYRARSVEAIRLCKKLEQDPIARYGTKGNQPGTIQDVNFWKHEHIHERILEAIMDAVRMACSTTGTDRNIDIAFDTISDLLRAYSKEDLALSIEGLNLAKQKDEHTVRLFRHFSAKYGRDKPVEQEKHLCSMYCGRRKTILELLANYPPKVQAPMWGLNKRCSSPPRKLSLKNSNFYPSPLIKGLSDHSIGRLFGLLEGQTHGLRPWVGQHAPRAEVYGGDPTGWYIKLGSGGLSSISTGTIEHENLKRVVLQDVFGQLVTRKTVENVIKRLINTEVIRYTAWSPARLQADALRIMAGIPLFGTETTSVWIATISSPQSWAPSKKRSTSSQRTKPHSELLRLFRSGPLLAKSVESPLHSTCRVLHSGVIDASPPVPMPSKMQDVLLQLKTQTEPFWNGENNVGISKERTLPSNTRSLHDTYMGIQDSPAYVLSAMNGEAWSPLSSPHERPRQSPQSNGGSTLDQDVSKEDDSGYSLDRRTEGPVPSEASIHDTGISAAPLSRVRAPKRARSKVNGKGIETALSIASSGAVFLLPDNSEAFPEAKFEKKKSWVRRHMVDPVKKVVMEVIQ